MKKCINNKKGKLLFRFGQGKWIGELCQKDSFAPSLYSIRNRNNTVCEYVNLKSNIEEFQRSGVPFPVGILVHLNELQEGAEIIKNLKKGKAL